MGNSIVKMIEDVRLMIEQGLPVPKAEAMQIANDLTAIRRNLVGQHYKQASPEKDAAWLEMNWTAQSAQFAIDLLPIVHRLMLRRWKRQDTVTFLDLGAGSGAGAAVWALLHGGNMIWSRMEVDAYDVNAGRELFSRLYYPAVNYRVGDALTVGKVWDIVVCSHVIEHVPDPASFIESTRQVAKEYVIFYAPYNEDHRILGHVNTITEMTFAKFDPIETHIVKSMAWRAAVPEDKCIIAVIPGTANKAKEPKSKPSV